MDLPTQESPSDQLLRGKVRRVLKEAGIWTVKNRESEVQRLTTAMALFSRFRSEAHADRRQDPEAFSTWLKGVPEREKCGLSTDVLVNRMSEFPELEEKIGKINADFDSSIERYTKWRTDALLMSAEIEAVLSLPIHSRSAIQVELLREHNEGEGRYGSYRCFLLPSEMKEIEEEGMRVEGMVSVTVGRVIEGLVITCVALMPFIVWLLSTFQNAAIAAGVLWWLAIKWSENRQERSSARQLERLARWAELVKNRLTSLRV
jgi:hypothetical protein